jgi:hypothetical protein
LIAECPKDLIFGLAIIARYYFMPDAKRRSTHLITRRELSPATREGIFQALFRISVTNSKAQRQHFTVDFDAACIQFVEILAQKSLDDPPASLIKFLQDNPWPAELEQALSEEDRAKVVVLNAIKQWLSKEAAYLDTLFTGGQFRKKLKALSGGRNCPQCNRPFAELANLQFHHTVRDGRPPIPLCAECHERLEQKSNQSHSETDMDGPRPAIMRLRKRTNASWKNLHKAVRKLQELPHEPLGTKNVKIPVCRWFAGFDGRLDWHCPTCNALSRNACCESKRN